MKNRKLQQSASQTRCLIRILPFLISNIVDPRDPLMRLLTTMNRILEIIFSPTLTHILTILSELIIDHVSQLRQNFPSTDYINKLHHLFHYPRCCLMSGPLQHFNCFMQENSHKFYKIWNRNSKNYKNLIITLSKIAQTMETSVWGWGNDKIRK